MDYIDYLQEELNKDISLWKELENELRSQQNPRERLRLEADIKRVKKDIEKRHQEIEQITLRRSQAYKKIELDNQQITKNKLITEDFKNTEKHEFNVDKQALLSSMASIPTHGKILQVEEDIIQKNNSTNKISLKTKIGIGVATIGALFLLPMGWHQLTSNNSSNICLNGKINSTINLSVYQYFSCGEKTLITGSILYEKYQGIKAYEKGDFKKAVKFFELARSQYPQDPETLIYLNNAKIERDNKIAYTIAVVVPMNSNFYASTQILMGVAQAQEEFWNEKSSNSNIGLKVLIANDDNNLVRAKKIANFLVKQSHVLAVMGHYASDLTLRTRDIYENGELVVVSPGSTSAELPRDQDKFFFRTIPSLEISSIDIARYLEKNKYEKVAIFHNPSSDFSSSFFKQLDNKIFPSFRISIINQEEDFDFNLSNPYFEPSKAIQKANVKGIKTFIIIPDGGTSSYSIGNSFKLIKATPINFKIIGANTLFTDETLLLGEDAANRLLVTPPWIQATVSQSTFANKAKELWGGRKISPWTVTGYDAAKVLIEALFIRIKKQPTRLKLRNTLADSNFEAKGADEKNPIKFEKNGNRKKKSVELAKIVKSKCSQFGYIFVPEEYNENQIQQLNSSCK